MIIYVFVWIGANVDIQFSMEDIEDDDEDEAENMVFICMLWW